MTQPTALECAWCRCPPHFVDGTFMGCCSAGHCENEGYASIEEWNAATILALHRRVHFLLNAAAESMQAAENIKQRLKILHQQQEHA